MIEAYGLMKCKNSHRFSHYIYSDVTEEEHDMDAQSIKKTVDEIFDKGIKSAQIELLRQVLKEQINTDLDDFPEAVRQINSTISDITAERVDSEALYRFTNNINYRNPGQPFNSSPKTLLPIAYYLTHPNIEWLDVNELKNAEKSHYQAAIRLAGMFNQEEVDFGYAGIYRLEFCTDRNDRTARNLELRINRGNTFYIASEIPAQKNTFEDPATKSDPDVAPSHSISSGWAVRLTSNILFVVLNSTREGTYCYISAASPERSNTGRVMRLPLVRLDSAHLKDELGSSSELETVLEELKKKIVLSQRDDNFSCKFELKDSRMSKATGESIDEPASLKRKRRRDLTDSPFLRNMRFRKDSDVEEPVVSGRKAGQDMQNKQDQNKISPALYLIDATQKGETQKALDLIASGTDINSRSMDGLTPVHVAAFFARWETLDALLKTGKCDLLVEDDYGRLPSEAAVMGHGEGQTRMVWVKKLLHLEDKQRATPSHQLRPSDWPTPES
jgi:hypothetical protein